MKKRNKRKSAPKAQAVRAVQGQQVFFGYGPGWGYGFGGIGGVGVGIGVTPFGPTFGIGAGVGFPIGGFGYFGGWL